MSSAKKGSDRVEDRRSLGKLKKQVVELEKLESPDRLSKDDDKPVFIKRNIYLNEKLKTIVKDHGIFCSCSLDPGSSKICGSDCSCVTLLSNCSSSCTCKGECTNKPFQQRHIKKMKLVQTEKCGNGIAADEDIEKGDFIIEYVGEVIDEKICQERLWKLKLVETNFYLCQISYNMVIDATHKGNKSRYINHSCNPNAEMQKWIIDGETRIGIFANRFINKGEELTYDYQFVQFGADQDCYCGSVDCRKKLGAKPIKAKKTTLEEDVKPVASKKVKKRSRRVAGKSWINSSPRQICSRNCIGVVISLERPTKQRCFGIITQYDEFSRKHLVMYEDGVTETIDMSREVWNIVNV